MELGVKSGLLAWSVYRKLVGISTFSEICIFKDGVKMPQIGSKIAKKGVKLEKSAQKSATFDAFRTFLIKKGVNPNSPVAALLVTSVHCNNTSD